MAAAAAAAAKKKLQDLEAECKKAPSPLCEKKLAALKAEVKKHAEASAKAAHAGGPKESVAKLRAKLDKKQKEEHKEVKGKQVKKAVMKKVAAAAAEVKVEDVKKKSELHMKKNAVTHSIAKIEGACLAHENDKCEKKSMAYQKRVTEGKKTTKKIFMKLSRKVDKRKILCRKKAKWDCKKKAILKMNSKLDVRTLKLIKLQANLVPWQKEQKAKKKKKNEVKLAKWAKQEREKAAQRKKDAPKELHLKSKAKRTGCLNKWKDDICDHVALHCHSHPVLRLKCRRTCAACAEKFAFHTEHGKDMHGHHIKLKPNFLETSRKKQALVIGTKMWKMRQDHKKVQRMIAAVAEASKHSPTYKANMKKEASQKRANKEADQKDAAKQKAAEEADKRKAAKKEAAKEADVKKQAKKGGQKKASSNEAAASAEAKKADSKQAPAKP